MARPLKQGIDYFPLNVDFFSDVKVRKIARACGPNAASILICLLCNIYRNEGYYILWDEDLPFVIADEVGVTEGCVKEIIIKAIQVGFFDAEMYSVHRILTSRGIQKRYLGASCKRKEIRINEDFLVSDGKNRVIDGKNRVSDTDNRQSKVNRNIINNSNACACEGDDDFFVNSSNAQLWIEDMCMRFHLSSDEVRKYLDEFRVECKCKDISHESETNLRRHFHDWLRININRRLYDNNKRQTASDSRQPYNGDAARRQRRVETEQLVGRLLSGDAGDN